MKFSIAYAAKWGHALHVELTFAAADCEDGRPQETGSRGIAGRRIRTKEAVI